MDLSVFSFKIKLRLRKLFEGKFFPQLKVRKMEKNNGRIIIGVFLLIAFMFLSSIVFIAFSFKKSESVVKEFSVETSQVAVVEIKGAIMESKQVIKKLLRAEKNDQYKAIIVRVDSPGGAVGPTQEIYDEIIRIDEKKPIYASFGSVAASGGYYIGAAARKIFANKGSITGSIGVIMSFMDASKVFEFLKLNPQIVKSGLYKDIGSPNRSLTTKEKDLLEGTIAKVHQQFRDDILKRREKRIKGKIVDLTQGQIFSGEEAKEYGLVDELGGLYTASKFMHEELKLDGDFRNLAFIKKRRESRFSELLEQLEEPETIFENLILKFLGPKVNFF